MVERKEKKRDMWILVLVLEKCKITTKVGNSGW